MAPSQNPQRQAELLDQILDYLQDRTLASLTFRTLAGGLGISSYVLVYHFGSREELLGEIVAAIEARLDPPASADVAAMAPADFRSWLEERWKLRLLERNRQFQRLAFEASVQDVLSGARRGRAPRNHQAWAGQIAGWLTARGLDGDSARYEARLLVASLQGLAYDYVVTADLDVVNRAHRRLLDRFMRDADLQGAVREEAVY